eukprot:2262186-Pleurochrysis_carterae.AAC.3
MVVSGDEFGVAQTARRVAEVRRSCAPHAQTAVSRALVFSGPCGNARMPHPTAPTCPAYTHGWFLSSPVSFDA